MQKVRIFTVQFFVNFRNPKSGETIEVFTNDENEIGIEVPSDQETIIHYREKFADANVVVDELFNPSPLQAKVFIIKEIVIASTSSVEEIGSFLKKTLNIKFRRINEVMKGVSHAS